ncbi:hypothetical protein G6F24_017885 [Rhizopus arrhizus]|nr:hypothetical protein G6F24_017885 [Rhizopus arrhizus]
MQFQQKRVSSSDRSWRRAGRSTALVHVCAGYVRPAGHGPRIRLDRPEPADGAILPPTERAYRPAPDGVPAPPASIHLPRREQPRCHHPRHLPSKIQLRIGHREDP